MGIRLQGQTFNYDVIMNTDRSDLRYPRFIRNESTETILVPFNTAEEEPIEFKPGAIMVAEMGVAAMFAGDFKALKVYEQDPGKWEASKEKAKPETEEVQEAATEEDMDLSNLESKTMIEVRRIARLFGVVAKVGETKKAIIDRVRETVEGK